jgi:hypothetical protein
MGSRGVPPLKCSVEAGLAFVVFLLQITCIVSYLGQIRGRSRNWTRALRKPALFRISEKALFFVKSRPRKSPSPFSASPGGSQNGHFEKISALGPSKNLFRGPLRERLGKWLNCVAHNMQTRLICVSPQHANSMKLCGPQHAN